MVTDGHLELRPVSEDDLPWLRQRWNDPDAIGRFNWTGFRSPRHVQTQFEEDGYLGDESGLLVVERTGEIVGTCSWHTIRHGVGQGAQCWNIGVGLLPDWRGQGIGTRVHLLLVDYLFATTTAQRIEAGTEADNHAEQRALEKSGFHREGVLRATAFRDGQWRDVVLYSRLRDDPGAEAEASGEP